MVDPGVLHAVAVEACMGFLLLAVAAVTARIGSDVVLRMASARSRLAMRARTLSRVSDSAATFALVVGVFGTTLAILTGAQTLSTDARLAASSVPAGLQAVVASQGIFLGAILLRLFAGPRIWRSRTGSASYASLVLVGGGVLVLENPAAVPLFGEGSLLSGAIAAGAGPALSVVLSAWAPILLVTAVPIVAVGLGLRVHASRRESARRETVRLARDVKDLLGHAKRAGLDTAASRRLIRQASAAARQHWYSASVKLITRAKRHLMTSLSFEETPEGDWLASSPAPIAAPMASPISPPAPAPVSVAAPVAVAASVPKPRPRGSLATAVVLAQRHQGRFTRDPLEAVQEELKEARTAILDLKVAGRDITPAIRVLKDANDHVLREEWDEALECLRAFRREIQG